MANVKNNVNARRTRRTLVEVAGEVFAEHGLNGATAKQITDRAKVNIAAVNYHFKDKKDLYVETLRQACIASADRLLGQPLTGTAEERLRQLILHMVRSINDPRANPPWKMKLLSREIMEPTVALDWVADIVARPLNALLTGIIMELAGPDADKESALFLAFGIVSQCLFFTRDRSLVQRIRPDLDVLHDPVKLATRIADAAILSIRGQSVKTRPASRRSKRRKG